MATPILQITRELTFAKHVVGKAGTQLLESDNSNTRHRVARSTRMTKVVSRFEKTIDLTMRLWAYSNKNIILQSIRNCSCVS